MFATEGLESQIREMAAMRGYRMTPITANCRPFISGREVSEMEMMSWELERARSVLALLSRRIGVTGFHELLAADIAESEQATKTWLSQSDGRYVPSCTELEVNGCTAEAFLAWFHARAQAGDHATMNAACPDHFVVNPVADGRLDVIETVGGYGGPTHFFMQLGLPDSEAPEGIDPAYPIRMIGIAYNADGQERARALHQFVNTPTGFKAKLIIYFAEASPPELIEGHKWHLACEFTNWVNIFLAGRAASS